MFLLNLNTSINRSVVAHLIKRSISSTILCRASTKLTPTSNTFGIEKKSEQNQAQTYNKPLTEDEIQKIINVDNIHVITKTQTKRPQRAPLLQNFFIGQIDREMLTYPQIELKDVNAMVESIKPIANYFLNNTKMPTELRFRDVSNEMLNNFRRLKLFGLNVGEKYGGRGLYKGEMAWASESEANDIKSYLVLAGHRLAVEAIAEHGTESQQIEYLMEMAKGELIGATCLHDPLSNTGAITVTKTKTPYGDEYILNGSATWTVCSRHTNLLIVVAKKSDSLLVEEDEGDFGDDIDYEDECLTFVLDAKTNGITFEEHNKTIGCDGVPFSRVNFFEVRAPKSQLLSQVLDERHLSQKLNECHRLQMSVLNMVQAKKIINQLIEFVIQTRCCGVKLMEQQFILSALSKNAMDIYALESMIYLTTGIIDDFDNPKVDLESAVTKAFSQDILKNLFEFAIGLMGGSATIGNEEIHQDLLNALHLQNLGGTSDALKKYVATKGIEHCVEYYGNNTDNYKDSFLVKWGIIDPHIENYRAKKRLGDFLHPSMKVSADNVDESIYHLKCASEMLLSRYKEKTLSQRIDLRNLGEMAMYEYGMFASIGRSSRGYCLGLRYGKYETVAAANFVFPIASQLLDRVLEMKEERNVGLGSEESLIDSVKKLHQKGVSPFLSVRQTGVMAKTS